MKSVTKIMEIFYTAIFLSKRDDWNINDLCLHQEMRTNLKMHLNWSKLVLNQKNRRHKMCGQSERYQK